MRLFTPVEFVALFPFRFSAANRSFSQMYAPVAGQSGLSCSHCRPEPQITLCHSPNASDHGSSACSTDGQLELVSRRSSYSREDVQESERTIPGMERGWKCGREGCLKEMARKLRYWSQDCIVYLIKIPGVCGARLLPWNVDMMYGLKHMAKCCMI